MDDDEELYEDDAAMRVGEKILEAAERVKAAHAVTPGARATWNFEIEETRFAVTVCVASGFHRF